MTDQFNIEIMDMKSVSRESPETRSEVKENMLNIKKEDSFFNGITMNKIMKSHKSRKSEKQNNREDKVKNLEEINKNYNERNKQNQSLLLLPMISENSRKSMDFDEDQRMMPKSARSRLNKEADQKDSMKEALDNQSERLQIPDKDEESSESHSELKEISSTKIEAHYYDRLHFLPDTYDNTEATRKKISRLFDASPTKIVPVIENCNRPAIDFYFKGTLKGEVDESFLKNKHLLNQDRLNITDRLDHKNLEMCSFLDVSCCRNEEMDVMREQFIRKVAYLNRLNDFVYGRYKSIFQMKPREIDQIFGKSSDNFIEQCVGNNATYVRSVIDFMETDSFEYDLKIKEYTKAMINLTHYFSCKLCDGNDNHRTFYYNQAQDELKLFGNETLALYFLKLKLLEISVGVFVRKVAFLSKLVLCKVKKVSQLKMNEEENGSIRWVQNFYTKCKGELFYLLPENFDIESELFTSMPREDLNEYLAMKVSISDFHKGKPSKMSNISISESCRKALFGQDSNLLNFRDNFDIVRLTEFNYEVLTRFFSFLNENTEFVIPTREEWGLLEQSFGFSLRNFKQRFEDRMEPDHLRSTQNISANELYPFTHSPLSLNALRASHNLTFNLNSEGITYAFLEQFEKKLLESVQALRFIWLLALAWLFIKE